jgi:hypothetical protein
MSIPCTPQVIFYEDYFDASKELDDDPDQEKQETILSARSEFTLCPGTEGFLLLVERIARIALAQTQEPGRDCSPNFTLCPGTCRGLELYLLVGLG